jgi:hypothetical protein
MDDPCIPRWQRQFHPRPDSGPDQRKAPWSGARSTSCHPAPGK